MTSSWTPPGGRGWGVVPAEGTVLALRSGGGWLSRRECGGSASNCAKPPLRVRGRRAAPLLLLRHEPERIGSALGLLLVVDLGSGVSAGIAPARQRERERRALAGLRVSGDQQAPGRQSLQRRSGCLRTPRRPLLSRESASEPLAPTGMKAEATGVPEQDTRRDRARADTAPARGRMRARRRRADR